MLESQNNKNTQHIFTGNIYIFHSFDVGDDINLEKIETSSVVKTVSLPASKYFKNYHRPIAIELADRANSPYCVSCKVHNFGVISFTYKIPFTGTLESMRKEISALDFKFFEQSAKDSKVVFDAIKDFVSKAFFYHMRSAYSVFQIDPQPEVINIPTLKENYGGIIASALRFETETLAEYKKNEILESAMGYFRGDLIIVDSYATFLYDAQYQELLDLFEFANIQQLELHYFDLILDQQLNLIYEGRVGTVPTRAYFPFIGVFAPDPVGFLGKLKADISVITERLEGGIKLAGEPYYSELYGLLMNKLDIKNWNSAIDRKLSIIRDVQIVYQHKMDAVREDILSILIIILIFIELVVGILSYLKH